ncbi:MAG: hypothetical protein BWK80_16865 [Desulfobacteraceae bacterium IS3]|nr:MAG: hypothetical protein BWK80_16865 [Desulfobacteraceae bacterium IS3]
MDNKRNLIICLLFIAFFSGKASAQEDTLNASHAANHSFYVPGAVLTITNRIEYTGTLTALGMNVNLPRDWSYVSVSTGGTMIRVMDTGDLEIFWTSIPTSPVEFSYMVKTSEESISDQKIESRILYYRSSETERIAQVLPDYLIFEVAGDINNDGSVTLADAVIALRVGAGTDTAGYVRGDYAVSGIDVSGDDKVGIEEAVYVLTRLVMQKE